MKVLTGICWIAGLVAIRAQGIDFVSGDHYSEIMMQVEHPPSGNPDSTVCFLSKRTGHSRKSLLSGNDGQNNGRGEAGF